MSAAGDFDYEWLRSLRDTCPSSFVLMNMSPGESLASQLAQTLLTAGHLSPVTLAKKALTGDLPAYNQMLETLGNYEFAMRQPPKLAPELLDYPSFDNEFVGSW